MKVIIAGSRTLEPSQMLLSRVIQLLHAAMDFRVGVTEVVCGMAKGVDLVGKRYAEVEGIRVKEFPVTKDDWKSAPLLAGILRNERMGNYADALIAIWDGKSTGTKHMFSYMQKLGKPYILIRMP